MTSTFNTAPSVFLPALQNELSFDISRTLQQLNTSIQCRLDDFERKYTLDWLTLLISRLLEDHEMAEEMRESLVAESSSLVSYLSGPSARGAQCRQFTYTFPNGEAVSIDIRSGTLVGGSLGTITWSSAPLLAHMLVSNPQKFFSSPSNKSLRVLELGSGTGLVGLTAAKILRQWLQRQRNAQAAINPEDLVVLSDFDPNVLENLQHNLEVNFPDTRDGVTVRIMDLSWNLFLPDSFIRAPSLTPFSILLAADIMYDPDQVPAVYHTVLRLLSKPDGIFHLVIPLRETHRWEIANIEESFDKGTDGLKILRKEELWGDDEFGDGEEKRHRYFQIGWA
ncbi:hypothetical protein BT69DRAFT_1320094 [Atractiella rhizophila]|nr:hypothetical protein BT69DRAFT_1320094 [Atractiella rhizophila]